MDGFYALKPWYATRLRAPLDLLIRWRIAPSALTWTGVLFGAAAGVALAVVSSGVVAALVVAALLAARLACANLDGGLARANGQQSRWGAVENELGDRLADLLAIAGCAVAAHSPALGFAALAAATLPSWVSLAGAAAGAPRINGGPVGKTERCALLVVAAAGLPTAALATMVVGSVVTAGVRLVAIRREVTA